MTRRRKRLDMIGLPLADLSSLRLFLANHKFDLVAQVSLNRTAKESSVRGQDLVHDVVARSPDNLWISLILLGESEETEYKLQVP